MRLPIYEVHVLLSIYSFFSLFGLSVATIVNRTIDDALGDEVTGLKIAYSPSNRWNQGRTCTVCTFHPDPSRAQNGTWQDASHFPTESFPISFSFQFTGTAFYIYHIVGNNSQTFVNITLDGKFLSSASTISPLSLGEQFEYNQLLYGVGGLSMGNHSVNVSAGGANFSTILFDYVLYTTDDGQIASPSSSLTLSSSSNLATPSTSPPPSPLPAHHVLVKAIVGGTVGGVVLLAIIVYLLSRFWKPLAIRYETKTDPFVPDPESRSGIAGRRPGGFSEKTRSDDPENASLTESPLKRSGSIPKVTLPYLESSSAPPSTPPKDRGHVETYTPIFTKDGIEANSHEYTNPQLPAFDTSNRDISLGSDQLYGGATTRDFVSPTSPSSSSHVMHELATLRAEMNELRSQTFGPLPDYSPPGTLDDRHPYARDLGTS